VEDPALQTTQTIRPAQSLMGSLRLPGDKSISHRYAMLAAFAEGTSHFTNFSTGGDCASSLGCAEALGAKVERSESTVTITGCGGHFKPAASPLDCGNSGSTMRMLSGLLAAQQETYTLIGDASLSRRPMERVRKPLAEMGASIVCRQMARRPFTKLSALAITANWRCRLLAPNCIAGQASFRSMAARSSRQSTLLFQATFLLQPSSCAPPRCFPIQAWFSMRSA
jgi:5-enolpyruvylshikimate-3-phosphate synthase